MNIVVLIKQVPDTWSERRLTDSDHTLDRASADVVLDEINERAVEEALKIKETGGGEVTVVTMGPQRAIDAIRKALSMGADSAVHLTAVVSVNEKINEPRSPSFKGIMAAKKKPVRTLSLADAGIAGSDVGLAAATSTVIESAPRPPRSAGQVIADDGDGAARLVEDLIGQKLI